MGLACVVIEAIEEGRKIRNELGDKWHLLTTSIYEL